MKEDLGCTLGNQYKITEVIPKEKVDGKKLKTGLFSMFNPVLWLKDLSSIFNVRKLIIYALIIGAILGYGYYQGLQGRPVKFDIGYGKEVMLRLTDGQRLHISENGLVTLEDSSGNVLKVIKVKDIPELQRKLRPWGIQCKPIVVAGMGIDSEGNYTGEAGLGLSLFRIWKMNLEVFATNKGIYGGTSYSLTDNFGIGLGAGVGYKNFDQRILLYARWRF